MRIPAVSARYHGKADVSLWGYLALNLALIGWAAIGWYLFGHAYWPSSCRPDAFIELFTCSFRLPESGRWIEAALLTWLWSTPLLLALDVSRRYRAWQARRADRAEL